MQYNTASDYTTTDSIDIWWNFDRVYSRIAANQLEQFLHRNVTLKMSYTKRFNTV